MKSPLLLLVVALLAGCATAPSSAPGYRQAPPAPSGYATIYLYRVGAPPTLRKPNVVVNETLLVEPAEMTYTWAHIKAGSQAFRIEWAWDTGWPPVAFTRELAAGQSYYFKLSGSFENKGLTGYNTITHILGTRVGLVPQVQAESELAACCKYIQPERQVLE